MPIHHPVRRALCLRGAALLLFSVLVATVLAPALLLVGCNPDSDSAAKKKPGYVRPERLPLPPPTPESIKRRLTNPTDGIVPHVVAPASDFVRTGAPTTPDTPSASANPAAADTNPAPRRLRPRPAPELIPRSGVTISDGQIDERDWSGITLVPKNLATSLVHTTKVAIQYIEVHPLADGSVRIWARLKNLQGHDDKVEVGCSFCTNETPDSTTPIFHQIALPPDYVDIFFVSPKENINAYTFLVRDVKTPEERRRDREEY